MLDSKFFLDYKMSDVNKRKGKNGLKIMSTFACTGGSTTGYKLAGFDVVGACEIDPKIANIYQTNHNPKQMFTADIRKLLDRDDLPEVDILDGSPPCSTFTVNGDRDKALGKEKKFSEGQEVQVLSNLFNEYLKLVEKMQPKVSIAENVKGILMGTMKNKYHNKILRNYRRIGYTPKCFVIKGVNIGLAQKRERVFYIAVRNDFLDQINFDDLAEAITGYKEQPVVFGQISTPDGPPTIHKQMEQGKFGVRDVKSNEVCNTITSGNSIWLEDEKRNINETELLKVSSWPRDFDFCGQNSWWALGMSVPPRMSYFVGYNVAKYLFGVKDAK